MMAGKVTHLNDKLSEIVKEQRLSGAIPAAGLEQDNEPKDYWPVANPATATADLNTFLRTLPGIENFSVKDINILARNVTVTLYPARHVFTHQGERNDLIFLVVDGAVLMRSVNPVANTVTEKIFNVGEWFSLPSLISNLAAFATVTAPKQVLVASVSRDDFNRISDESLAGARFFLYMLVNELARKVQSTHAMIRAVVPGAQFSL